MKEDKGAANEPECKATEALDMRRTWETGALEAKSAQNETEGRKPGENKIKAEEKEVSDMNLNMDGTNGHEENSQGETVKSGKESYVNESGNSDYNKISDNMKEQVNMHLSDNRQDEDNLQGSPQEGDNLQQSESEEETYDLKAEIFSWIKSIGLAFIIAMLIRTFVFEPMRVPTGSMIDTIQLQDTFFINKFIYRFKPVERGDIIVFWFPDDPTVRYVKRVIGIGGDKIEIKDGQVYLNDQLLDEPYIYEPMRKENAGPFIVPEDHYFVMGDNRNDSKDSRYWQNKYVSRDAIIGKLGIRIYPLNRFGIVR